MVLKPYFTDASTGVFDKQDYSLTAGCIRELLIHCRTLSALLNAKCTV